MRSRVLVTTAVLAILVSFSVTFAVQAYRNTRSSAVKDPFALLDLSSTQQRRIREISKAYHPSLVLKQAAVEAKRQELADRLASPNGVDAAAVEACLAEVSRLESELDREVVKNLLELRPHLTAEQQQTLFEFIELRHVATARATK